MEDMRANSVNLCVHIVINLQKIQFYFHRSVKSLLQLLLVDFISILCQVMAYYISFLKTLSLKLNKHTIHFFYNEVSSPLLPFIPQFPQNKTMWKLRSGCVVRMCHASVCFAQFFVPFQSYLRKFLSFSRNLFTADRLLA